VPRRPGSAFPAAENNCGIVQDRPAPNRAKPATPAAGLAMISPAARPPAASRPQPWISLAAPILAASRSPSSRPSAIVIENAANPVAANPADVPRLSRR
jgi:hypothetical protein